MKNYIKFNFNLGILEVFTYNPDSLYINFLDFLNPTKIFKDSTTIDVSLNENNQLVQRLNLSVDLSSGPKTFPVDQKVQCLAKIEMAFHALNSKIVEELPELNGENFSVILKKIKIHFGGNNIIPQCYEVLRIIRNNFQHDKSGNLTWEDNDLVIYQEGIKSFVITLEGLNILIYLIWYSLKNNTNHLYNRVLINKFYYNFKGNLKLAKYVEKNKKGEVRYEFFGLLETEMPWNTFPIIGRTTVRALSPEKIENGFKLKRLKCFNDTGAWDENNKWVIVNNAYTQTLDYYFLFEDEEYLVPEEYFKNYKDGEDAVIPFNDFSSFKYIPSEMAIF